jgi:hypothetical protein
MRPLAICGAEYLVPHTQLRLSNSIRLERPTSHASRPNKWEVEGSMSTWIKLPLVTPVIRVGLQVSGMGDSMWETVAVTSSITRRPKVE